MDYQSPAVYVVYTLIVALGVTSAALDEDHVEWTAARSVPGLVVAALFLCDIVIMAIGSVQVGLILGIRLLQVVALVNWVAASFTYGKSKHGCNRTPVYSLVAVALFVGFLAGELNNDNNFVEKAIKKKAISFIVSHPIAFARHA